MWSSRSAQPKIFRLRATSGISRHHSTIASFHYLEDRPEYKTCKPYHINIPSWALPPGQQTNEVSIPFHDIPVTSLRGRLHDFTLDHNGFQVVKEDQHGPESLVDYISLEEYSDEHKVKELVRPAVESFLKRNIEGVEDVIAFSSQIRRRDPLFPKLSRGTDGNRPQPVQGVHVDFAPNGARAELAEFLSTRGYHDVSRRRWQIISVWRPLFGPLKDWPLGLLDYTSIDIQRDLVASDNIYTHVMRETYNVLHNPKHRWYYLEDQQPDEVLIFKTFDTNATKSHARVCPHAAFCDPAAPDDVRPRESFECLSAVLFPEGSADGNTFEEVEFNPSSD
ncbi:hypothetical protein BKA65DRAFT_518344 [Rhexocercosporidium sp. MPI-PUGE-AT-0058]|nr:hypothetical protein BKA65DRAFT_518344 [Rhexocercosporidium sp. MPI-PUGE-AT-0058]